MKKQEECDYVLNELMKCQYSCMAVHAGMVILFCFCFCLLSFAAAITSVFVVVLRSVYRTNFVLYQSAELVLGPVGSGQRVTRF